MSMSTIKKTEKKRLTIVFIVLCLMLSAVLIKAFSIQVVQNKKLIAIADAQTLRSEKVYPNRGNIYDRNGDPLAINIQTYSLFTIPRHVKNGQKTYKQLSKIVPELTYQKIRERIQNRTKYTWLARKISLNLGQVEALKKLEGVYVEAVPKRIYPNKELLSQTLGLVGLDNVGLSGVEYLFNEDLKGKPRITKYLQDAKGRPIKFESKELGDKAKDIYLTIDKDIQAVAEKYLKEAVDTHKANKGGIGVIDVRTGEIIAMANYPTFDANGVASRAEDMKLSYINEAFEPGSVFKMLTVASALENKTARPNTKYFCENGSFRVADHIISEAEASHSFDWLTVTEILQNSSNIGTTKIAFDLTYPRFKKTLQAFHIGDKTGIEVPGESRGIFTDKENVSSLSLSNMSFGQGVATTALQILAAYAAIANDGIWMPPTIIRGKNDNNPGVQVVSKQTAQEITYMLTKAVSEGTGTNAQIPFFQIAGKTGTAQRVSKSGGYKGYIPSFAGFPVNIENRFAIYVYIDDPRGGYYGNVVAAPVFKKVAEYMLLKNNDLSKLAVSDKKNAPSQVSDSIKTKSAAVVRFHGPHVVPNFIGLDKKSARQLATQAGIELTVKGMGMVNNQSLPAGTAMLNGGTVALEFSAPKYE